MNVLEHAASVIAASALEGFETQSCARDAGEAYGASNPRTLYVAGKGWFALSATLTRPDGAVDCLVYGAFGRHPRLSALPTWRP